MGRRVNNGRRAVKGHPYNSSSWAKDLEKALKKDWKKKKSSCLSPTDCSAQIISTKKAHLY